MGGGRGKRGVAEPLVAPFFATESKSDSIRGSFFCSSNQNRPFYFRVLSSTGFFVENFVMIFFFFKKRFATENREGHSLLPCYRVLPSFSRWKCYGTIGFGGNYVTEFYRVLPSFTEFFVFICGVSTGRRRDLPSFTEFFKMEVLRDDRFWR